MIELENSENILERQKFARFLKDCISDTEKLVKAWEELQSFEKDDFNQRYIDLHKEALKNLKIRLSNYDIYNQKIPYKCSTCGEAECVCGEIKQPIIEPDIVDKEIDKMF